MPPPARTAAKKEAAWKPKKTKAVAPKAANTTKAMAAKQKSDAQSSKSIARSAARDLADVGYEVLGPIASGAYSTILRARNVDSGREVAVKSFDPAKGDAAEVADRDRELEILRLIQGAGHAHIANLIADFATPHGVYAVLQCCSDSLQRTLQKLGKKQLAMIELDAVLVTAQSERAPSEPARRIRRSAFMGGRCRCALGHHGTRWR